MDYWPLKGFANRIPKIPIIALTAFAFADDRLRSQEAGCNEHLAKPVKIEELKYHLVKYLAKAKKSGR